MNALRQAIREQTFGFLLIPGLVALGFVALAVVLLAVDLAVSVEIMFAGDASGARELVSAIGGSLITVAGLAFSITIITFQLVSSQFSPRALRGFLGDRINQVIAGMFVGTFAYCLLVLGSIRDATGQERGFVPSLSVTAAIVLALIALAALLFFIHHMSQAIQVSQIASDIGREALDAVNEFHPADRDDSRAASEELLDLQLRAGPAGSVFPSRPGFVQSISVDDILAVYSGNRGGSSESDRRVIHVTVKPGDFITEARPLAKIWPQSDEERVADAIRRSIRVADGRDIEQDVGYAIRQLVDIALRAISPAVK